MDTATRLVILGMGVEIEKLTNLDEDRSEEIKEIAQRLQKTIMEYPTVEPKEDNSSN
jgi:hypothetical protein